MISERIRKIKQFLSVNNTQLAEAAGVTRQAVGNWINLGAAPSAEAVINLRMRLNISDEWLILGRGAMLYKPVDAVKLGEHSQLYKQLGDRDQQLVVDLMRLMVAK